VRCPPLSALPSPPPDTSGWPWTEESVRLTGEAAAGLQPRLSIVTPSLNQGRFIEETIRSILLQGYPHLEYFVIDGGSTDGTLDIIRKYSGWIDAWVSEPDSGQSSAINRGLRMSTGSHATWINSDDMLCKDALTNQCLRERPTGDVIYAGDCLDIDERSHVIARHRGGVDTFEDLVRVGDVWQAGKYLSQQEVLFPRDLAMRVGGVNERNHYSMDYELWGRLLLAGATLRYTGIPFGCFRRHLDQKTHDAQRQTESLVVTAETLIGDASSLSPELKSELLAALSAYRRAYPSLQWKQSGRLSRLGLPRCVVTPVRRLRRAVEKGMQRLTGTD